MSYSCETNAILPQVQLLIGIGFGPVRFECHENVDILDIRPPKKRRSRLRTRAGSALICGRNPAGRHGVSTESGSDRVKADSNNRDCQDYYPVATALGTDLILKLGHYSPMNWWAIFGCPLRGLIRSKQIPLRRFIIRFH